MYLQIWSFLLTARQATFPFDSDSYLQLKFEFGFVLGCLTQLGVIFTCLETASVEILNILASDSFFNLSSSFPMEFFLQSCDLRVFQWIHPRKVWGSLVICGVFPGRFLNDFGLSCLDLTCLKENLSIFGLESLLRKQRVDFHSTSFAVPVLI